VLTTLLLLAISHPLVVVEGEGACPSPEEVERRLATIIPPVDEGERQDRARVEQAPGALRIELMRDDGTRVAERRLQVRGDCADMAAAAAVVIATWEGRLKPEPGAPPALPAGGALVVATPASAPPRPLWFDVGAAIVGARADGQSTAGAELDGSLGLATLGPRLGATISATLPREQPLPGTSLVARWMRVALAAGPRERLGVAGATVELGLSAAVAVLHIEGGTSSQPATTYALHSDTSAELGGVAGVRVGYAWPQLAVWAGFELWGWLGRQRLEVNVNTPADLPALDARLALGVSWGRLR
jgi:hypothetical protein